MLKSQKFIDSRTGEIVTQVPLSQIQYFDQYGGTLEAGQFDQRIAGRQQAEEIMRAADWDRGVSLGDFARGEL